MAIKIVLLWSLFVAFLGFRSAGGLVLLFSILTIWSAVSSETRFRLSRAAFFAGCALLALSAFLGPPWRGLVGLVMAPSLAVFGLIVAVVTVLRRRCDATEARVSSGRGWLAHFSARSLMTFIALAAITFTWGGVEAARARRQQAAADAIRSLGGDFAYKYTRRCWEGREWSDQPPWPSWFEVFPGNEVLDSVRILRVHSPAEVEYCSTFSRLEILEMHGPQITDEEVEKIAANRELQDLDLRGTSITDGAIDTIVGLSRLQALNVADTRLTRMGLARLHQALPNTTIYSSN